jgi:hypothetical protein
MMVYGDKSTGHIAVQLHKSEAAGGKRKVKDLLAEELTFREDDDVHYSGLKLSLRFVTTDSEAKLISDGVENLCGGRGITHLKSPPRSHRYNIIEGRMKTPVSKALSAYHCSGYPLAFFLHAFVHAGAAAINILTTGFRSAEEDMHNNIRPRHYLSADSVRPPHSTDLYPFGAKVYVHTRPRRSATSTAAQGQGSILPASASPHPPLTRSLGSKCSGYSAASRWIVQCVA